MKRADVDWSEAGRKAWATRRANAEKNAEKLKRTNAATKAWATRKANKAREVSAEIPVIKSVDNLLCVYIMLCCVV